MRALLGVADTTLANLRLGDVSQPASRSCHGEDRESSTRASRCIVGVLLAAKRKGGWPLGNSVEEHNYAYELPRLVSGIAMVLAMRERSTTQRSSIVLAAPGSTNYIALRNANSNFDNAARGV